MRPRMELPRRELAIGLGLVLAVGMLAVQGSATGAGAAGDEGPDWMPPGTGESAMAETMLTATLLTGDHVTVTLSADGHSSVTVDSAAGSGSSFYQQYRYDDDVYVIPSEASPLIPELLDPELFNVTKLAEAGYTEATSVIVQYEPGPRTMSSADGMRITAQLPSIDAVAATIEPAGQWWESMTGGATRTMAAETRGGVKRVWLDEPVRVSLADSVPQIGAPQAWQSGFDGSGVTVAVLDTGIDDQHPDLTGKVAMAENFTDESDATDGFGHGTHVASTVAGSGAASGGANTGAAPGATLLNGKVLDGNGNGQASWVLAGMEWAAANADVVNMSLGAGATDGTDPISQALNALTAQHGTLFVVSAGNSGPSDRTVSAPGSADAALTVGAVDKSDQLASFSSRGPRRGDWAIKPDVTAPGVNIVAARAAGTSLCLNACVQPGDGPVDANHTSASGTSMAAPHVAGAAAIVLQNDPDLTPEQLKAALVTTAEPHDTLTVYQQGGGRIDVPAALDTPVLAEPAILNLGFFEYPHDDAVPMQTEVSYTNRGDETVTLDLSIQASAVQGPPVPAGSLTVDPATLEVAPGQTAAATITLDVPGIDIGLYSGQLRAEYDGELVSRVPVGFHKEDEMYDLSVTGIDRAGQPAGGLSNIAIVNVDDMSRFFRPGFGFVDGEVLTRVPPGTYAVLGAIVENDAHGQFVQAVSFVGDPEITVAGDTELTLDAREANRIEIDIPEHETAPIAGKSFGYWRGAEAPGPFFNPTWRMRSTTTELYLLETEPVTKGVFEFHSRWKMAAPEAELSVASRGSSGVEDLDTYLLRAPAVDGEKVVPLVDLGAGEEADFAGADLTGAAALVSRHPDLLFHQEQERMAAEAGAVALLVANDVPGHMTGTFVDPGEIPTLSVTQPGGERLRELLAEGEVRVRLSGTVWSDYLYDLVLLERDRIPAEPTYLARPRDLATLEMAYHNDQDDHLMTVGRSWSRPFHTTANFLDPPAEGPRTRTEYVVGGDLIDYRHTIYGEAPFEARMQEQGYQSYENGRTYHRHAYRQVVRPALLPQVTPTTRSGDTLELNLYPWVDSSGMYFPIRVLGLVPPDYDTFTTKLWRDGELVGTLDGLPTGRFPMADEPAEYRVDLEVSRVADWWTRSTETRTEWTFTSQRPDSGDELVPMLSIDYAIELDLRNTALHPRDRKGPSTLELEVYHQDASLPAVDDAQAWVSFDDGDTWRPRPVRQLDDGRFQVSLPGAPAGSDAVSLRVAAVDAAGNQIDQTIIRAWKLPDR